MYLIGMGAALFTGESDIAQIMVKAGLGIAGLLIVVFSTVTTTFLDAYSAGISSESIALKTQWQMGGHRRHHSGHHRRDGLPDGQHHRFYILYLIGSVFAPMIAF